MSWAPVTRSPSLCWRSRASVSPSVSSGCGPGPCAKETLIRWAVWPASYLFAWELQGGCWQPWTPWGTEPAHRDHGGLPKSHKITEEFSHESAPGQLPDLLVGQRPNSGSPSLSQPLPPSSASLLGSSRLSCPLHFAHVLPSPEGHSALCHSHPSPVPLVCRPSTAPSGLSPTPLPQGILPHPPASLSLCPPPPPAPAILREDSPDPQLLSTRTPSPTLTFSPTSPWPHPGLGLQKPALLAVLSSSPEPSPGPTSPSGLLWLRFLTN